jgi:hypothetical protein
VTETTTREQRELPMTAKKEEMKETPYKMNGMDTVLMLYTTAGGRKNFVSVFEGKADTNF